MEETQAVAQNETGEAAASPRTINAVFNNKVDKVPYKFNFKKDELGNKRPSVELTLPVPSVEGIIDILGSGDQKQLDLLLEAVQAVIIAQARNIISDKEDASQDNFPFEQVTWEYISNIEPKERRGGGIPKETWEEFAKDYVSVMPALTGKSPDAVGNAAKIFLTKFSGSTKTAKPILTLLKDQLAIYAGTPRAEDFAECVEFLVNKADKLLNMSDDDLLKNL